MKNTFYFLSILLTILFFCSPLNGQNKDYKVVYSDDELVIKEIDPDTYLAIHTFPWPANSLVIKFGKGQYLFIDTPYTDEATKKLVDWFEDHDKSEMKITVVNTHFHVDNLGGNGYLKSIGAVIYGSDLTAKLLKERGLGTGMLESFNNPSLEKYYTYYKDKVLTAPDKLFPVNEGLKLSFPKAGLNSQGNDTLEVWYPGPGHTPDNVVVYYPAKKLLFGGCILKSMESNSKGNIGDADLNNWSSSLENLLSRYPDAQLVIPGHGKEGGIELIKHSMKIVK